MTLEGYELERPIGSGASGTVWRARRVGPVAQVVAIKRLPGGSGATELERLRREAAVLAALDHPHVVRIIEVRDDGDGVALVMQYAPGGSLEALLAERHRLAPGEVVAVAAPIADALGSAHRRGVVHGDVKPANVLFTSDGEPLLGDFGVARTLGRLTGDHVTGTAAYLAPELLEGSEPTARTDVYSLGVVCYEALAGAPPYGGSVPLAVVRAADRGEHQPLSSVDGVPEPLAAVVEQAMARHPEQRFPSADAFARALRAAVATDAVRLPGPPSHAGTASSEAVAGTRTFGPRPPRREGPPPRRRRLWVTALAGGVALLAVGALVAVDGGGDDGCPTFDASPQTVEIDPEGDGSTAVATYQIEQGEAPDCVLFGRLYVAIAGEDRRFRIGEPGDQVLFGDWNCDGAETPAVYRRSTGQVAYHDTWPESDEGEPRFDQLAAGGTAAVAPAADGRCASVTVTE